MKNVHPDFFILGTMKSGTTWLMECLNYHPDITCFNELMILTLFRDGIGKILNTMNRQIVDGSKTTFREFIYPTPEYIHDDVRNIISVMWQNTINSVEKQSKFFGEKSPDYINILDDIVYWYPNTKLIHIVRNPKDVAISYYYHIKREIKFYEDGKINQVKDLCQWSKKERSKESMILDAITMWKSDQSIIETMKKRFPDKFLTIKYEDMKSSKTLHSVYSFIGAKSSIELSECVLDATDIKQRPKVENTFFKFAKSTNWKNELDENTIQYINTILGDWRDTYHYE